MVVGGGGRGREARGGRRGERGVVGKRVVVVVVVVVVVAPPELAQHTSPSWSVRRCHSSLRGTLPFHAVSKRL